MVWVCLARSATSAALHRAPAARSRSRGSRAPASLRVPPTRQHPPCSKATSSSSACSTSFCSTTCRQQQCAWCRPRALGQGAVQASDQRCAQAAGGRRPAVGAARSCHQDVQPLAISSSKLQLSLPAAGTHTHTRLSRDGQHEGAATVALDVRAGLPEELHKQAELALVQRPVVALPQRARQRGHGARRRRHGVGRHAAAARRRRRRRRGFGGRRGGRRGSPPACGPPTRCCWPDRPLLVRCKAAGRACCRPAVP